MYKTIPIMNYALWKRDDSLDWLERRNHGPVAPGHEPHLLELNAVEQAGRRFWTVADRADGPETGS